MLKKLLFALAGLVVIAVAGALVAPSFVDWNQYKNELSTQARAATGRDLAINGDLSLAVLPTPTLSAEGVTLANLAGGSQPEMLRLGALRVRVALAPLLQGRIEVEEVILERPAVLLEVLADGRRNWDLLPENGGQAGSADSGEDAGDGVQVQLERVVVRDATVRYRDAASGTEETVSGLNAEVSAGSLQGPFEGQGSLTARGVPLGFSVNLGELGGPAAPLALAVMLAEDKAKLQLNGQVALGDAPQVSGRVTAESANLAAALAAAGLPAGDLPNALADPFGFEAALTAGLEGVQADDATMRLADMQASGALSFQPGAPPRIDATFTLARIDLEALLPRIAPAPGAATDGSTPADAPQPADAPAETPGLPQGIAAQVDLTVGTVQWGGGQVRQAKLNAALEGGELSINQASALLPGGSDVALFGFVTAKDGALRLDGQVEAVSENLRAVLDWLGIAPEGVPAERLRNLALTAKLSGTPEQVSVADIDLRVDSSRLTGGVTVALRDRPAFGIGVKLDKLNLDSYRTPAAPAAAAAASAADPQTTDDQLRGGGGLAALNDFDANLRADIGTLTVNGTTVSGLSVDGTLFGGELSLRRARVADVGGATANITGAISGFGGVPKLTDTTLRVRARDARSLARLAGVEGSLPEGLGGRLALDLAATGTMSDLKLDLSGELADLRLALDGQVAALALQPRFGLAVQASHPDLVKLLNDLGVAYQPALTNSRQMAFTGQLRGDLTGLTLGDIELAAGPVRARGTAGLVFGETRPRLTADLTTNEIIADLLLPVAAKAAPGAAQGGAGAGGGAARWSDEPIDFSALRALDAEVQLKAVAINYDTYRVDQPKMDLGLQDGVLEVRSLDGTMFGGTFAMTGRLGDGALQGTLAVKDGGIRQALIDTANIDLADGRLDFDADLAARGSSPAALVASLAGDAALQVRDGVVRGFDLDRVSAQLGQIDSAVALLGLLETGMGGGETRFSRLNGTFKVSNGVARTEDLIIEADSGAGQAVGDVNLGGWSLDMNSEFRLTQHPDAPPFGMRLVGPLDNPRKLFQIERLQAYLLQRGAGRLIERFVPEAAPFLGGGRSTAPAQPATPEAAPGTAPPPRDAPPASGTPTRPTPEDFLKGILGNIGR